MRTYKPISTISYNSKKFLKQILADLERRQIISFYACAFHKGVNGKKDHFHVYIEPLEQIDTNAQWWKQLFIEVRYGKEVNVMPWQKSKFDDWFLYARHDKRYLKAKGLLNV